MVDRDEVVLALARQAYREKPFYRWFYDNAQVDMERAQVQDLPFLTKQDLFHYETEMNQAYYLPVLYPESQINMRRTSGTTGRLLTIPWLANEFFFSWTSTLFNLFECVKGRPRILAPVNLNEAAWLKDFTSLIIGVPQDKMADTAYILDLIQTRHPNVFMDSSPGIWFNHLLGHGLDPQKAGLQLLIAYPNQQLEEQVEAMGLHFGSVFACEEAGMLGYSHSGLGPMYHLTNGGPEDGSNMAFGNRTGLLGRLRQMTNLFPCDCYKDVDLASLVGRRDLRVRLENGGMGTTGRGQLTMTCANSVFPLIKYLNADLVEILPAGECACGFSGRTMKFFRREHQVRVPFVLGGSLSHFNLANIASDLKGFKRVFPVYYALESDLRIIVTFVEDDRVTAPRADTSLSGDVLAIGGGMTVEQARPISKKSYLPFLPVIHLPPGTIPIRDSASIKTRMYLDTVSGQVPAEYQPVLSLIEEVLDLSAIQRAGNAFLMPPIEETQRVEA